MDYSYLKFWYPTAPNLGKNIIDRFRMLAWEPTFFEFAKNHIMYFVLIFLFSMVVYKYFARKFRLKNNFAMKLLMLTSVLVCLISGIIIAAVIIDKVMNLSM